MCSPFNQSPEPETAPETPEVQTFYNKEPEIFIQE
jgi:hypothetical protein